MTHPKKPPLAIRNFSQAEEVLAAHWPAQLSRVAYTLDNLRDFMTGIGNPQDTVKAIHIAGTSGKTSTAFYAASLLKAAGHRVGLLTSPHIKDMNERIRIDLEPLSEQEFCQELSIFMRHVQESGIELTYAEILYALGFWVFARKQVTYMVIEVGLGGLLDATNIMNRHDKVCVITDIGFDHVKVLGNTLDSIAAQKAGIISLTNAVFCYHQSHTVDAVIDTHARRKQADLHTVRSTYDEGFHFLPPFQQRNATLALAAVRHVLRRDHATSLTDTQIQAGVMVRIPGRMEVLHCGPKTVILDGSHNPQKLTTLFESIQAVYPGQPIAALAGFLDSTGRSADELLAIINDTARHIIATTFPATVHGWHRSQSAADLERALTNIGATSYDVVPVLPIAVSQLLKRPEPVLVITGSFYMLDMVRQRLADHIG